MALWVRLSSPLPPRSAEPPAKGKRQHIACQFSVHRLKEVRFIKDLFQRKNWSKGEISNQWENSIQCQAIRAGSTIQDRVIKICIRK